jgi:hypothetical protein
MAPQTDPIKYRIGRLTNDVTVNITVYSEVKFYPEITNLYLRNQVHHIVALIAKNALELTYAYLYFK